MAQKNSTKAAVLDEELDTEVEAEISDKKTINDAIARVVEATGVDSQKARYKAMRAIAFQAFTNAIEDGTFDELVDQAIANVDDLPSGWEIERVEKAEKPVKAKAAPAKAASKAAPTKKAASTKTSGRRRPQR